MASRPSESLNTRDAEAAMRRAVRLFDTQRWEESLLEFDKLLTAAPPTAAIHNYRARAHEAMNRHEEALQCLSQALSIGPANVADLRNRAIVQTKLGRLAEAAVDYAEAVRLRPESADLRVRYAIVLNQMDRREDALQQVNHSLALAPEDLDVLNARVIILDNLGRYTDALDDLDRMLTIKPNHLDAINNCGMILARLGRFEKARICYEKSLALKADQPQAKYNLSLIRLSLGDWIRGFKEFESRWNTAPLNQARLVGLGPLWLGEEELNRKTILVYHEQGYGDTLQFVRYLPLLAERGATVILAVPPALASLMSSLQGVSHVVSGLEQVPEHHYQAPLMSLALAFRTTPDTIPASHSYLAADTSKAAAWKTRLGPTRRLRIGLAWGGRRYAPINYPRDIALAALRPLLSLDAEFYSLQKEIATTDREVLAGLPQLRDMTHGVEDFSDTAAFMDTLDLVITVDTAIAHLAGALGKPVWLMNRYASCWRWLQEGSDSAWYPTLRQFRQSVVGDWTSVVTDVRQALVALLEDHSSNESYGGGAAVATASLFKPAPRVARYRESPKLRFVSATRLSSDEFLAKAPLGRSLPIYRTFPKRQVIELRLFPNNTEGLSTVYNVAIEEARSDPAVLIFIHDDVYLSDYYWAEHLHDALEHFDLVGLAGNVRRVPRQASWMFLDAQFTRDNYDNLSGVLGHGDPFPNLRQLSVYGEPGRECKLLDGVMMAIRSETLIQKDLRFDPRFKFDFYDLDFCRQAELRHIRMGTWAISVVHASAGALGVETWRAAYADYLAKYMGE